MHHMAEPGDTSSSTNPSCCCCSKFRTIEHVLLALSDETITEELVQWLSNTNTNTNNKNHSHSSKHHPCGVRRAEVALLILNSIRDACRPFLETASESSAESSSVSSRVVKAETFISEDSFPSLSSAAVSSTTSIHNKKPIILQTATTTTATTNLLTGRRKIKNNKPNTNNNNATPNKHKRRVRPMAVTATTTTSTKSSWVWGQQQPQQESSSSLRMAMFQDNEHNHHQLVSKTKNKQFPSTFVSTPPKAARSCHSISRQSSETAACSFCQASSAAAASDGTSLLLPSKKETTTSTITAPTRASAVSTAPSDDEPTTTAEQLHAVQRLVRVYCSLIENCLVPSTTLELELLFRVLVAADTPAAERRSSVPMPATTTTLAHHRHLLSSWETLDYFAVQSLEKLSGFVICLGRRVLVQISEYKLFQRKLPFLVKEANSQLERCNNSTSSSNDYAAGLFESSSSSSHQTPHFTLPFDETRDSRHNFRTRDEQALYQNREASRDAFLHELRSFLSARGRLMNSFSASQSPNQSLLLLISGDNKAALEQIRVSSRIVVDAVQDVNRVWFANFFIDLFLQLGLVPIQETDKDILKITKNKEKLQKLHNRFSCKSSTPGATQGKSSTKKLSASGRRHQQSKTSPTVAAQVLFPGHQEFFYTFLLSADSYIFNMHLRSTLAARLQEKLGEKEEEDVGLSQRLLKARMLARLLGVLLFSPYWRSNSANQGPVVESDALQELSLLGLHLPRLLRNAELEGCLILHVPWVTELLKMAAWDNVTRHSEHYQVSVRVLRNVQLSFQTNKSCSRNVIGILRGCIESLFDVTLGMTRCAELDADCDGKHVVDAASVDVTYSEESSPLMQTADPHFEEILSLLSKISKLGKLSLKSPGISRKLRPSFISPPIQDDKPVGATSPAVDSSSNASVGNKKSTIETTLRDTFFHNYPKLRKITEFASEKLFRLSVQEMAQSVVQPIAERELNNEQTIEVTEQLVLDKCTAFVERKVVAGLESALALLADPGTSKETIAVACALASRRALISGRSTILSSISSEVRRVHRILNPSPSKKLFATAAVDISNQTPDQLQHFSIKLECLGKEYATVEDFGECIVQTQDLHLEVEKYLEAAGLTRIPSEDGIRRCAQAILDIDQHASRIIEWTRAPGGASELVKSMFMLAFLRLACSILKISTRGFNNLTAELANHRLLKELQDRALKEDLTFELDAVVLSMFEAKLIGKRWVNRVGS